MWYPIFYYRYTRVSRDMFCVYPAIALELGNLGAKSQRTQNLMTDIRCFWVNFDLHPAATFKLWYLNIKIANIKPVVVFGFWMQRKLN